MAAALSGQLCRPATTAVVDQSRGISGATSRPCLLSVSPSCLVHQIHCESLRKTLWKASGDGLSWTSSFELGGEVRVPTDSRVLSGVREGQSRRQDAPRLGLQSSPKCSGVARPRAVPEGDFTGDADEGFSRSKLAVFLSGGGSNFRALHASTLSNSIFGDFVVVVSDKPGCKGCQYAREHNIPVLSYPLSAKHAPEGLSATDLVETLRKFEVDYVLLAGYLKLIPEELVRAYPRSILNIHPALLPAFGGKGYFGMKVHEAVIKSGARFSGPTVHFVDEKYDSGPILAQRVVPVLADDSPADLAAKVLKEEHVLYSEAVAALCEDRVFWREDGVPIIRRSWDGPAEYY